MTWHLNAYADRSRYRPMSIALELASFTAVAAIWVGAPAWSCALLAVVLSIILTVMTFHRLRNGAVSVAWIWLMILRLGIGPDWPISAHLTVNLGATLISLMPVALAWFASADASLEAKGDASLAAPSAQP